MITAYDMTGPGWYERPDRHPGTTRPLADVPCQRPWVDTPPDPDELATWTAANDRARAAYYRTRDYQDHRAATEQTYRARKATP